MKKNNSNHKMMHAPRIEPPSKFEKLVDKLVSMFGTWTMLVLHVIWFVFWLLMDLPTEKLTLWVSLEAIILSIIILIAQKRELEINRLREEKDLEIDRRAEKQTRIIMDKLEEIEGRIS